MYERNTLLEDLRRNVIEVHFTKINGEPRVMRSTLMPEALPKSFVESKAEIQLEKRFHKENPDSIAVWDVDVQGWRSFRIDSVTYCQTINYF